MRLHVGWMDEGTFGLDGRVTDGGAWALFKGNGEAFLMPTQYGDNVTIRTNLQKIADLWNGQEN